MGTDAIRIRDKKVFQDIKIQSITEGYKNMEEYVTMLHLKRKKEKQK